MTLSAFTFANETPKQFAPFSIVTKEVSDKLDIEYKSMVDSIIHITRKTEFAYTEADIRKAATIVATEYSPCKYTQRIDILECQSIRDNLISYLTASVIESPSFKVLKNVDVLDETKIYEQIYEQDRESLSESLKTILKKGNYTGHGTVNFENTDVETALIIVSAIISDEDISNIYEEILLDDYKTLKAKQIENRKEASNKTPLLAPLIFIMELVEQPMELGLSDKRYACSYDGTSLTLKCKQDYKDEFIKAVFLITITCFLIIMPACIILLLHREKEKNGTFKDKCVRRSE